MVCPAPLELAAVDPRKVVDRPLTVELRSSVPSFPDRSYVHGPFGITD